MALDATPRDATWFDVALTVADDTEESVVGSDLGIALLFSTAADTRR